jgi:sugar/nucleoside kinase (ribokinase family)
MIRPPKLVCVGSVVVDIAMKVPKLPEPGGDVVARSSMLAVGGAFNVMAAARYQGISVSYAGGHGTGPFGDMVRSSLRAIGIEIIAPAVRSTDTGFTITFVVADGERTFATAPGAEAMLTRETLDSIPISPPDLVYVSGYGLAYPGSGPVLAGWLSHLETGIAVVVDPGPLVAEIPPAVLQAVAERCDWWTCNEREARLVTGSASPHDSIRRLAELAGREGVLVRLGRDGCLLLVRGQELQHLPARAVEVVDTTGAGDAHTGSFMAALAYGAEPAEAAHRANVAASIAVSRYGPATAPTSEELRSALAGER